MKRMMKWTMVMAAVGVAACGTEPEQAQESRVEQTGDYPTGRWMLATEGCGLADARQTVGGADGAVNESESDWSGGAPSQGVADASSGDWDDETEEPQDWADTSSPVDTSMDAGLPDDCDGGSSDAGDGGCGDPITDAGLDGSGSEGSGEEGSGEGSGSEGSGSEGSGEEGSGSEGSGSEGSGSEGSGSEGSADAGADADKNNDIAGWVENPWTDTGDDPLATFSSDIDTASYTRTRASLQNGQLPAPADVRVEDFLNYFRYPYPAPVRGESDPFFISVEAAPTPFGPEGTSTLRIAIQGAVLENCERPPTNLVFLVDVSGSMHQPNKLPMAQYAIRQMARQLNPEDRISIVTYAGWVEEVLGPTPASDIATIDAAVEALDAGGGTGAEAGLALAYEVARRGFIEGGVNRVVLCTDGDFNLGLTGQALVDKVAMERDTGVTLTALGFGTESYADAQLNALSDHGNGNYVFIDSEREADRLVTDMLMATLLVIGRDLKIQIELVSQYIESYRVIGYDTRQLADEDFANDHVDAGDVGAGHAVTALVEVDWVDGTTPGIVVGDGATLATINVRYKPAWENENSVLLTRRFMRSHTRPSFDAASDTFRLAVAAAEFAEILRNSEHADAEGLEQVRAILMDMEIGGEARTEMITLVETAATLMGM